MRDLVSAGGLRVLSGLPLDFGPVDPYGETQPIALLVETPVGQTSEVIAEADWFDCEPETLAAGQTMVSVHVRSWKLARGRSYEGQLRLVGNGKQVLLPVRAKARWVSDDELDAVLARFPLLRLALIEMLVPVEGAADPALLIYYARLNEHLAVHLGMMTGPLVAALSDEDDGVRSQAAIALGKTGDVNAIQPLVQALKDRAPKVRKNATRALGEIAALLHTSIRIYHTAPAVLPAELEETLNLLPISPPVLEAAPMRGSYAADGAPIGGNLL